MLKPGNNIAGASRTNLARIRGEAMVHRDVFEEPFAARRDQMMERSACRPAARRVHVG
jgi:hypothetical protein